MLKGLLQRLRPGQGRRALPRGTVLAMGGAGSVGVRSGQDTRPGGFDGPLVMVVAALVMLGTVMVYSASISLADSPKYGTAPAHFLVRHLMALAMAFLVATAAFQVRLSVWQKLAPWIFVGALGLLVIVLIPGVGKGVNGARRWISLGLLNLQPSEVMKVAAVLYAANFTVRKQDYMHSFRKGFAPMAVAMGLIGALLLLQPDLGAFGVIVAIAMGILFLGGVNGRLFAGITVALATAFALVIWLSPWRPRRGISGRNSVNSQPASESTRNAESMCCRESGWMCMKRICSRS